MAAFDHDASDGSANPEPVELPPLMFKARCGSPSCRALLGGFHIPCAGGLVAFRCCECGRTTVFKNEAFGIRSALVGPLVDGNHGTRPRVRAPTPPTRRPRAP